MNESLHTQVIVIGAGIAGLTAAWQLKKSGIDVLVLEADAKVGGRMQSLQVGDALIDCGAQFLSSTYSVIPTLIEEMGLSDNYVATSEVIGIVNNKNVVVINPRKPWQLVSNHLLSIRDLIRLGWNQFRLFNFQNKFLPLNDITAWAQYDNQLASDFVVKNFGETVARELTSTILNGFYFQSLNEASTSMVAAVLAFSAHKPQTMTLTTGMGSLPQKIADKLNVKLGVPVLNIKESSTEVEIVTNLGKFNAKHVILAVPAPVAKNLMQNPDSCASSLFSTPYSSTIIISLLTQKHWVPTENISAVYGFLFNPKWESKIAALTIENNKIPTRKTQGYLINVMLSDPWAKKMLHLMDEEIYAEIKSDIETVLPHICQNIHTKKIFRWQYAMPCTPIGRATHVKQYRSSRNSDNKIWLAGDYLGLPWTDSAAQTGIWAANQVCKYLLNK